MSADTERTEAELRYSEYLQSEHWQAMRERALQRWGKHCQRCGYHQPAWWQLIPPEREKRTFGPDGEVPLYDEDEPTPFSDPYPLLDEDVSAHRRAEAARDLSDEVRDQPLIRVRAIHVHHLTYLRRGRENPDHDFAVLCDDCHEWIHTPQSCQPGPLGWDEGMQHYGRIRFTRLTEIAGRDVAMDYAATFEANANKWLLWNGYRAQFVLRVTHEPAP